LILGGIGVGSGITGATLLAASAANAPAAVLCTGITTGILGFQTRAASEGFSRKAVQSGYTQVATKTENARKECNRAMGELRANLEEVTDKWNTAYSAAYSAVDDYIVTASEMPFIEGESVQQAAPQTENPPKEPGK
jgi:hypothetical protein